LLQLLLTAAKIKQYNIKGYMRTNRTVLDSFVREKGYDLYLFLAEDCPQLRRRRRRIRV